MIKEFTDLKINFFPRVGYKPGSPTNSKLTPISLFITVNKQPRIRIPGIGKVAPEDWNPETQRVKVPRAIREEKKRAIAERLNSEINDAETAVKDVFKEHVYRYNDYPMDLEDFKEKVERRIKGIPEPNMNSEAPKTDSFLEFMDTYIQEAKVGKRRFIFKQEKVRYSDRSIKAWRSHLKEFRAFCKATGRRDIKFNDIDVNFYNDFERYMTKKDTSVNYFGTYIKNIKKFMNESSIEGYHVNKEYLKKEFLKTATDSDGKALTIEQLRSLAAFDFSDDECYDNARDLFLVGCWTGLRFSDYSALTKENLQKRSNGRWIIQVEKTKKTKTGVAIPVLPELKEILKKYEATETGFPRAISDVKLNKYIKEICRIVGENSDDKTFMAPTTSKMKLIGGGINISTLPLYEYISTHVGRRSYATNAIRLGVPYTFVMKVTEHKTESSFWKYVKLRPEEYAELIEEAYLSGVAYEKEMEVGNG